MRTLLLGMAAFVGLSGCLSAAQESRPTDLRHFKSPDGAIIASVRSSRALEATKESTLEFRTAAGQLLSKHDYTSEDGEHGYGVTKAEWTPDSQFFVYSLESSGGHSAWHSPVQFFSRISDRVISLDDALNDAVMNPQFVISAPDRVTVELYFSKQTKTVALHRLRR